MAGEVAAPGPNTASPIANVKGKHFKKVVGMLGNLGPKDGKPAKVVCITGTTSGTGLLAAKVCAGLGAVVVLLNRPSERVTKSVEELKKAYPTTTFDSIACDLGKFADVERAAEEIKGKYEAIYCLANNAGIMSMHDVATEDGYDIQMQVNVLSHIKLTSLLFPLLEAGGETWGQARVVMHSSVKRVGPTLEAKYMEKNGANLGGNSEKEQMKRYQQTKLADAVFTAALADRLAKKKSKVISVVAHPGFSWTELIHNGDFSVKSHFLFNNVLKYLSQSPGDGCTGLLRCIADESVGNLEFYGPRTGIMGPKNALKGFPHKLPNEDLFNNDKVKELLWTTCEKELGPFGHGL